MRLPARIVLTEESADFVMELIEHPPEPTRELCDLVDVSSSCDMFKIVSDEMNHQVEFIRRFLRLKGEP